MPTQSTLGRWTRALLLLPLIALVTLAGCDEETVGPESRGSVDGRVQDASTNDPIAGASVTTSPPTQSILTEENGTFAFEDIQTGGYTVEVSKTGYNSRTVTVTVEENRTTAARILLEQSEDAASQNDSLTASVTNWYNDRINRDSTGADSIFADVEYSVRNVGEVPIRGYEVYFHIGTSEGDFSFEVSGDSLEAEQQDVDSFRKYLPDEAQTVQVDDIYYEAKDDA